MRVAEEDEREAPRGPGAKVERLTAGVGEREAGRRPRLLDFQPAQALVAFGAVDRAVRRRAGRRDGERAERPPGGEAPPIYAIHPSTVVMITRIVPMKPPST